MIILNQKLKKVARMTSSHHGDKSTRAESLPPPPPPIQPSHLPQPARSSVALSLL